jgi:hypothetical protein
MTSTNRVLLLAGGLVALGYVLSKKSGGSGFSEFFHTLMPQSATASQQAAYFAGQAGQRPSQMSYNGTGNTSVAPATSAGLAAMGTSVMNFLYKLAGPGNTAPPSVRPQASSGAGGGTDMPYGPTLEDMGAVFNPVTQEYMVLADQYQSAPDASGVIWSEQGGYDVMTGEWFAGEA